MTLSHANVWQGANELLTKAGGTVIFRLAGDGPGPQRKLGGGGDRTGGPDPGCKDITLNNYQPKYNSLRASSKEQQRLLGVLP